MEHLLIMVLWKIIEHCKVSKDIFIDAFFKSRENVNKAKHEFGSRIELNLIIKDFTSDLDKLYLNIANIDNHIKITYNRDTLGNELL